MTAIRSALFTCDLARCETQHLAPLKPDEANPPLPRPWVPIQSLRANDSAGDNVCLDGLTFCTAEHASRWLKEALDPPTADGEAPVDDQEAGSSGRDGRA